MSKKPETLFAQKVDKDLSTLKNAWFENIKQVGIRCTPDRIGCVNKWFVGIELKVNQNKPTPLQNLKLNKIRQAGGKAYTATPLSWKSIFRELKELDQSII